MRLIALRGANTVQENEADAILAATEELMAELLARNGLAAEDLVSCLFTLTPDLDAEFPAVVALRRGETAVTYVQQTPAGLQPVDVRRDGLRGEASVLAEPPEFGAEVDPGPVMAALGLRAEDAHPELPLQFVSTGLPALIIPVGAADTVSRARPDRA